MNKGINKGHINQLLRFANHIDAPFRFDRSVFSLYWTLRRRVQRSGQGLEVAHECPWVSFYRFMYRFFICSRDLGMFNLWKSVLEHPWTASLNSLLDEIILGNTHEFIPSSPSTWMQRRTGTAKCRTSTAGSSIEERSNVWSWNLGRQWKKHRLKSFLNYVRNLGMNCIN